MFSQKIAKKSRIWKTILVAIAIAFILPLFAFSSSKDKIYVDAGAKGTEDGSSAHPYGSINEAMSHADSNTEIHVANGEYKENVEIKKGVAIYGEDEDKVIIRAKDTGNAVIVMNDKTKIDKVTIKKGKNGIFVQSHAKASIIKCVIKDNSRNGIEIEGGDNAKSNMVSVSDNKIKNNGRDGIYSGSRKLSIVDNFISGNEGDGVDISVKNSSAWISGNEIRDNKKSGMKLAIDGADIWTKSNKIIGNKREGIEVSYSWKAGRVDIAKSKIQKNGRYGVARVQRSGDSALGSLWNQYLTFDSRNTFGSNGFGDISNIVLVK